MRRSSLWTPGHLPPVLFTRAAVRAFAALAQVSSGEALRVLARAARRTRVVREPAAPVHDLGELRPEELQVALLVRRLPGLEPLVCVWVAAAMAEAA